MNLFCNVVIQLIESFFYKSGTRIARLIAVLRSGSNIKLPLVTLPMFLLYTTYSTDKLPCRSPLDVKQFYASHRAVDLNDAIYAERLVKVYQLASNDDGISRHTE